MKMRRSFRIGGSTAGETDKEGANSRNGSVPSFKLPLWRRHLRSRVFRTTLLVILAHVLLWTPYNVYALMKYANEDMYTRMNEQANIFKDLQFLITIINPFLYGFSN
uniref:G-protein coupled receptors family 1 profile domain-containing protein n=1 Tax=Ditylenchus dipsaci TaxID=166011 RepID=A0A915EVY2_9BILA